MRDVVITGIGLRTPMGHTLGAVREVFRSGKPVIRSFEGPNGKLRVGARMTDDFTIGYTRPEQALLDPLALMALAAADDVLRDSGLFVEPGSGADMPFDRERFGVHLGTGQGTSDTLYESFTLLALSDKIKPFSIVRGLSNGAANQMAIRYGLQGNCQTTVLACSSSNAAMGSAMRSIRHGYMDAAIVGGVEATFCEGTVRAWEAMRVLARFDPACPETACRPYARDRTGLVLGEGAVLYVFEAAEHARARGARIYARVAGFGESTDATNLVVPDAAGQARSVLACLRDAQLSVDDVGYINTHGTATPAGDPIEVQCLRKVFGSRAEQIPVSSTKSLHGHMLGAAGAVELLAAIVALNDGLIAPTANLHDPDPACDLDFVPLTARIGVKVRAALSTSFAFGGSNACIALTSR